jgi:hypothetical protein
MKNLLRVLRAVIDPFGSISVLPAANAKNLIRVVRTGAVTNNPLESISLPPAANDLIGFGFDTSPLGARSCFAFVS